MRLGTVPGELDRQNGLWLIGLSANLGKNDLGTAQEEQNCEIALTDPHRDKERCAEGLEVNVGPIGVQYEFLRVPSNA